MSFFKNKHVITAMIVSPLLAIMAYLAVDSLVAERPHVAKQGEAYRLVAKSDCRYTSGNCTLVNSSFKSTLHYQKSSNTLQLESSHALQNATIGFVTKEGEEGKVWAMQASDTTAKVWRLFLPTELNSELLARIVLQANNAYYYAETGMIFINYETGFRQDFGSNN